MYIYVFLCIFKFLMYVYVYSCMCAGLKDERIKTLGGRSTKPFLTGIL